MLDPTGPILIVGRGKSGQGAFDLYSKISPSTVVKVYDDDHSKSDFSDIKELLKINWKQVVLSPGYPFKPWLKILADQNVEITQEVNLAVSLLTQEKVFAITGSVGKSTTAWVAKQALEKLGKSVFLGGNFGTPLADYVLSVHENPSQRVDFIVLELSSYQTERMNFQIDTGLILNLHPNHLDRYVDKAAYYNSKLRMQTFCELNCWALNPGGDLYDFAFERGFLDKLHWVDSSVIYMSFSKARLLGKHNVENLRALEKCLENLLGLSSENRELIAALNSCEPLEHRIEIIEKDKKIFVNDSKATTIESVIKAHEALSERYPQQKKYWLLGGKDKKLPWEELTALAHDKYTSFVFFGECREVVKEKTGFSGPSYSKLSEAMAYLLPLVKDNELCVLSPGGTALDEFQNFEVRGRFFKNSISER